MAGAVEEAVRVSPLRERPSEFDLTLRQADQVRSDFAAIADDLEFIMTRLSKAPTRKDLAWVAVASFVCGATLATFLNFILVH
jgi:hypothetical protein